jgi:hypothetical protein
MLFVFMSVLVAGCGERRLPVSKVYPAQGKVTLNGKPAAFVLISLHPTDKKGVLARGTTDENGSFELRTYSNEGNDGAVPGEYNVVLEGFDPVRGSKLPPGATPTRIRGEMDTGVKVEITEGDNDLNIDVTHAEAGPAPKPKE